MKTLVIYKKNSTYCLCSDNILLAFINYVLTANWFKVEGGEDEVVKVKSVTGSATVTMADFLATNGVVHVIDTVL